MQNIKIVSPDCGATVHGNEFVLDLVSSGLVYDAEYSWRILAVGDIGEDGTWEYEQPKVPRPLPAF
jgi:hypothetical protein